MFSILENLSTNSWDSSDENYYKEFCVIIFSLEEITKQNFLFPLHANKSF